MEWQARDYEYMARAIQLAKRASYFVHPNPKVGCVLVKDKQIVSEGWHERSGEEHAEVMALRHAGQQARGCTAYISLEPCAHTGKTPPCVNALIEAGVSDVIIAMQDPDSRVSGEGIRKLREAGISVRSGLLDNEAEKLNPGFLKRVRSGLPFVRCKMAMSLDGKTALANGESQWITSEESRRDVHRLRAESAAILTGINTVLADDPSMTVRHINSNDYQPLRVILDSHLRIRPEARVLTEPGQVVIVTASDDDKKMDELATGDVKIIQCLEKNGRIELNDALRKLVIDYQLNEILLESGSTLSGAMLDQGLIDELVLYVAAKLLGHDAQGLFQLPAIVSMQNARKLDVKDVRLIGQDVRIISSLNPD